MKNTKTLVKGSFWKVFVSIVMAVMLALASACNGGGKETTKEVTYNFDTRATTETVLIDTEYTLPEVKLVGSDGSSVVATPTVTDSADNTVAVTNGKFTATDVRGYVVKYVATGAKDGKARTLKITIKVDDGKAPSTVLDNSGMPVAGMNIYEAETGEVMLDTAWGDTEGLALKTGVKYVIEVDATYGPYKSSNAIFAGVENAKISNVEWSDQSFADKDGSEKVVKDSLCEVMYETSTSPENGRNGEAGYATLHRESWGNFWDTATYGWYEGPTKKATDGVYDTTAEGFWTIEPNYCAQIFGAHFLASKKSSTCIGGDSVYFRMTIEWNEFDTIAASNFRPTLGAVEASATNFNFFMQVSSSWYYAYLDGEQRTVRESTDYSYVINELGKEATGVRIYKEDGTLVLDSQTTAAHGTLLEAGENYVIEVAAQGEIDMPTVFAGLENVTFYNPTWSDKTFDQKAGENATVDTLCSLAMNKDLHAKTDRFHRLTLVDGKYTGTFGAAQSATEGLAGTKLKTSTNQCCVEFRNMQFGATSTSSKTANKAYFRITVCFSDFVTMGCGEAIKIGEDYGKLAAEGFNFFMATSAGSYYFYLTEYVAE